MNDKDTTSPSVSTPTAKETPSNLEGNNRTTANEEPLSPSITKELEAIKELIKENRETSLQKLTSNPAVLVVLTFLLTNLAGNIVTSLLTIYQQRLAAERSFSDELNKVRVQKVGEVWERLDEDGHKIDRLLDPDNDIASEFPNVELRAREIERIIRTDRSTVSKYRFWLGHDISERVNDYLNANITYSIKKLSGTSEADLEAAQNARDAAKSNVDQIREQLLSVAPKNGT